MTEGHTPDTIYSKCPICEQELREPSYQESYEGFTVFKAVVGGSITHRHNAANWLQTWKQAKQDKGHAAPKCGQELADLVLAAMNKPQDEQARKNATEALVRQAASIAAREGAQSMQALSAIATQIGEVFNRMKPPGIGEKCRLCGRSGDSFRVTVSEYQAQAPWMEVEA